VSRHTQADDYRSPLQEPPHRERGFDPGRLIEAVLIQAWRTPFVSASQREVAMHGLSAEILGVIDAPEAFDEIYEQYEEIESELPSAEQEYKDELDFGLSQRKAEDYDFAKIKANSAWKLVECATAEVRTRYEILSKVMPASR
jgi:hypothetical protein